TVMPPGPSSFLGFALFRVAATATARGVSPVGYARRGRRTGDRHGGSGSTDLPPPADLSLVPDDGDLDRPSGDGAGARGRPPADKLVADRPGRRARGVRERRLAGRQPAGR